MRKTLRSWFILSLLILCCAEVSAQITSDFAANADGWTTPNDADATISYNAAGGNPNGFVFGSPFIFVAGATTFYIPFYFVAPAKFVGNRTAYYNGMLRFDLQQSSTNTSVAGAEVIITNNAGTSLYYYPAIPFQPLAAPTWTTHAVPLSNADGSWRTTDSGTGPVATEFDVQNTLGTLASLQIRGLFRQANVTGRLDNVNMALPLVITAQPAQAALCSGLTHNFVTAATGSAGITYQWQRQTGPTTWVNVTNTGGYTGATATTLAVNTTGNFGAGNYRCRISATGFNDAYTSVAGLVVYPLPAAPTTDNNASCPPAALKLTAHGGYTGAYRWYTVATNGTPIPGVTDSVYTTPVVSVTTNYYVAFNNGTCESTRTIVTAAINGPAAPAATPKSSCTPAPITFTATGGVAGQYRWYSVATAGSPISGAVNASFTTPLLTKTTTYYVSINNGLCESSRTAVVATIGGPGCSPNTPPQIATTLLSTQVNGTITISLTGLITDSDGNLDLSTLKIITPPSSGASATIDKDHNLIISYSITKFSGNETITIEVCDISTACSQQTLSIKVDGDIKVFNAVSPRRDNKNDVLYIQNIELLDDTRQNHVSIFNRWGDMVWEGTNYNNTTVAFTGKSTSNGELPSGTYYYKIEFAKGRKTITGFLEVKQ